MASAIGSLLQRPETAEKSHPVPENSEANGGAGCPAQDSDEGSHGADPVRPPWCLGLLHWEGKDTGPDHVVFFYFYFLLLSFEISF